MSAKRFFQAHPAIIIITSHHLHLIGTTLSIIINLVIPLLPYYYSSSSNITFNL